MSYAPIVMMAVAGVLSRRADPWAEAARELAACGPNIDADDVVLVLRPLMIGRREKAVLVLVDDDGVDVVPLGAGTKDAVDFDVDELFSIVDSSNAHTAWLLHSHTGLDSRPSDEDVEGYEELIEEFDERGIDYDELIVTRRNAHAIRHCRKIELEGKRR